MTTPYPFVAGAVLTAQQLNDIQNLPISDKTASYTLAVADVYKRTMMNSASATTITVNNSIFTVGDVIQVANKGAGVCTVTAGAGVTINTSGSLALAQYGGGYLLCLSASTFTFFNLGGGANYGTATGGTSSSITVSGQNYTLLTFTSDSNLVVSKAGLFDILLVSGAGGAGSSTDATPTGGGGGGGVVGLDSTGKIMTVYLPASTIAVDVGAGGAAQTVGNASYLTGVVAAPRGGYGIGYNGNYFHPDGNGGTFYNNTYWTTNRSSFFNLTYGQYGGGTGGGSFTNGAGAGGGSASVGGNGTATNGGQGGNGLDISPFIGGSTYYAGAGGGGGGPTAGGAAGNGGVAGKNTGNGNNGVNYGAGGGGSYGIHTGGSGAAGAVFVRFKV